MPSRDAADPAPAGLVAVAAWVRRWLVGLLVGSYALAALVPGPGVWLRELSFGPAPESVRFSLVMVSVLLFCGAVSIESSKLRELAGRMRELGVALVGVWAPPVLVVAAWAVIADWWLEPTEAAALVIGLALAGAMPVANSAVAWAHQSGGSLVWALGLVVVSISVCPWVTPVVMRLMGLAWSGAEAAHAGLLVTRFTGLVFAIWVLGPTLVGFLARWATGSERVTAAKPALTLTSAAALLLLNYANAATALPSLVSEPDWALLATTVLAASTLPISGAVVGVVISRLARVARPARLAWAYSLGMKNTGLALGLAGVTLGDQPIAVLAILAVTLTQHAVAGAVHSVASR